MRHRCYGLCLALLAACQADRPPLDDQARAAIAASVDSATRAFEDAERARDADRVIAHLGPDFYMYNDGLRTDRAATVESIRSSLGSFRYFEPGFQNLEVRVLGRDAALVSLTFQDSIVDATGQVLRFRGPTTLIWERRGQDWLITYADADHYQ